MKKESEIPAGSAALTMCVKLTAPAPKETTAPRCVKVWRTATGSKFFNSSLFNTGAFLTPKSQTGIT